VTRSDFGGTSNDFLFKSVPFMRLTAGSLTFWSAASGGTQYTDLLLNGSPVTSITVDSTGLVPTFQGPDGITAMYADEGAVGGARVRMVAEGRQGPTGPQGDPGPALPADQIASLSATFAEVAKADGVSPVVNLVPSPLSLSTADWTAGGFSTGGDGTVAVTDGAGFKSTPAFVQKWTVASTNSGTNQGPNLGPTYLNGAPVTVDLDYVASLYAEVIDTPGDVLVQPLVMYRDASTGALISQVGSGLVTLRKNKGPQRLTAPASKAPAGAVCVLSARIWTPSEMGTGTIRLSAPQVEQASAIGPFRHGDMPGAAWVGTPNDSATFAMAATKERYAAYGDSHFGQNDGPSGGNVGYTLPAYIEEVLGREVVNGGRGGETSTGIAMRAGAIPVTVSVAGGSIPATTTAVVVTPTFPVGSSPIFRDGTPWTFECKIAGVIGILQRLADTTWDFTRQVAGSSVSVPSGTPVTLNAVAEKSDLWFLQMGANLPSYGTVLADIDSVVAKCRAEGRDFLVFSIYNNSSEPSGSTNYNLLKSINDELAKRYAQRYIDTRRFLIDSGLAASGLTPTSDDLVAISEDRIPPSLMDVTDGIHLNPTGRQAVAGYVRQVMTSRGLIKPGQAQTRAIAAAAVTTPTTDVQVFTASGTWTKPASGLSTRIYCVGGGGGGGGGRRGAAASVRAGGAGGGGGARSFIELPTSALTGTVAVTVGTAGSAGAAATANDTTGGSGGSGGTTTFGSYLRAGAGTGGAGGGTGATTAGSGGTGDFSGTGGAASSATGAAGSNASAGSAGAGGGGGGGVTAADSPSAGGFSGDSPDRPTAPLNNGGTVPGGAGSSAADRPANSSLPGGGGGGGAASITGAGGGGGNGGLYGGGGGGGGAALNGNNSGAGGAGAAGICVVITTP
jgi:hypothetical protein